MSDSGFHNVYRGRRIFVTGHTGFKGSWLTEWLLKLGAQVTGYALPPPTNPALFEQLGLSARIEHRIGDVRDLEALSRAMREAKPEFVFHLAAQPLVRASYVQPVETFATNVMGTVNVMEAARGLGHPCRLVVVTTDKCYENREWLHSYREEDSVGGWDPYSASKGAAEIAASAYRRSYFNSPASLVRLATARAGNVIGGGDWAQDRIVPDCIRALRVGAAIPVRNRVATRPWQHVLEPLSGYLWLGAALDAATELPGVNFPPETYATAFNFGPTLASNRTVRDLVEEVVKTWPGCWEDRSDPHAPHEAKLLNLAIDKAQHLLSWAPVWSFEQTVRQTVEWYRQVDAGNDARMLTASQITAYSQDARSAGLPWAR